MITSDFGYLKKNLGRGICIGVHYSNFWGCTCDVYVLSLPSLHDLRLWRVFANSSNFVGRLARSARPRTVYWMARTRNEFCVDVDCSSSWLSFTGGWAATATAPKPNPLSLPPLHPSARNPTIIWFTSTTRSRWIRPAVVATDALADWLPPQVVPCRAPITLGGHELAELQSLHTFASYSIARHDADRRTNRLIRRLQAGASFIASTAVARDCLVLWIRAQLQSTCMGKIASGPFTLTPSVVNTFWLYGFRLRARINRRQQ